MAAQLEPLFGPLARDLLAVGLLGAGLSSALTAPLATAFAVTELVRISHARRRAAFRGIALSVLVFGAGFALSGVEPIEIIVTAQFANGLLLPVVVGFLLYAMNDRRLLGEFTNGPIANALGGIAFLVTLGLGARLLAAAAQRLL